MDTKNESNSLFCKIKILDNNYEFSKNIRKSLQIYY